MTKMQKARATSRKTSPPTTPIRDERRPIGVDLFAGAGGLSLGFEQAGFDVVAAVEIDPIHCAVHKFNFPDCAVIPRSVTEVTGQDIRAAANIGKREIDVVFGGAPCQGFSMIGHRALDDPRNSLVREFVRIVDELKPKHFVFENVKGLTIGKHRKFLDEIIQAFRDIGYSINLPWNVLNAANFAVPQSRQRLILLGSRTKRPLIQYPADQTRQAGEAFPKNLPMGPSCAEALDDLPDADHYDALWNSDSVRVAQRKKPSSYAAAMRCETDVGWYFGHQRIFDANLLTSSARTEHTDISRQRFNQTKQGEVEPISRLFRLPSTGVSNTLRAGTDAARGAFTSPRPIHHRFPRLITVREMARLHGYPDWFRFHVTKWHGARQIGNSVPPPMARAIASEVIKAIGVAPVKPQRPVALGDSNLLSMVMASASRHWQVKKPSSKRDRKSGSTKRKQADIPFANAG